MSDYQVDPELRILKPLKFKKYTNTRRFMANFIFNLTMILRDPKKGLNKNIFGLEDIVT